MHRQLVAHLSEQPPQARLRLDRDLTRPNTAGAGRLLAAQHIRKMLMQRAAERHVEQLRPAAGGKERQTAAIAASSSAVSTRPDRAAGRCVRSCASAP
jgi:hypothetical protein